MTDLVLSQLSNAGGIGVDHRFARGDNVWEPGDRADSLFFLRRGQVAVKGRDADDGVIIRVVDPGEPFGELCFCTVRGARPTTARAVVESEVVKVSLEDFLLFLEKSRGALSVLLYTFCIRLTDAERRVEMLSYRGAEARVGHLLLHLASNRGRPVQDEPGHKLVEVTHEDLAGMAAMNRSHLTVTMGKLRKQGLISYGRREPLVVHVPALADHLGEQR